VEGSGGYNVSLSLLFTAANPGMCAWVDVDVCVCVCACARHAPPFHPHPNPKHTTPPGDLVPYQTFRVSSLDGTAPTKAAVDSSPPQMILLPKGVPSYSIVAAITGG
jgi:hypothetical protein